MRIALLFGLCLLLQTTSATAQGLTNFDRPGPDMELQKYYAQVRTEVNQVLNRWADAWDRDDAPALASFYDANATYLPAASAAVQTRAAIREYFGKVLPSMGGVEVHMADFGTSGELAYITARVNYSVDGAHGNIRRVLCTDMLVLRRRANSEWRIQTHLSREEPEDKSAAN